ncbi:DUF4238 domain-containing protein [Spirosoma pomorum]
MARKKNQHFVPQFLMKNFSCFNNRKTISIYNIKTNLYLHCKAPIKGQAQSDYFYGEDLQIENMLATLEQEVSPIFNKIIDTNKLPPWGTDEYAKMHIFTMIQSMRTKYTQEEWNESFDMKIKAIYRHDKVIGKFVDDFVFGIKNAASQAVSTALDSMHITYDLKCKLIINTSNTVFLLSDHPAVKYNQFLKGKNVKYSTCGFGSLGVQIILPISPRHSLIFYDSAIYDLGYKNHDTLKINLDSDINVLNTLQVIHCDENLYFNEFIRQEYITKITNLYGKYRRLKKNDYKEFKENPEKDNFLFVISGYEIDAKVRLPSCVLTKNAEKYVLGNRVDHMRQIAIDNYKEKVKREQPANDNELKIPVMRIFNRVK